MGLVLLGGFTYLAVESLQMKKTSIEKSLGNIINVAGKILPFYELLGLLTAPRCEGCGERKVFILGFDYCWNCKHATGRVFLAF